MPLSSNCSAAAGTGALGSGGASREGGEGGGARETPTGRPWRAANWASLAVTAVGAQRHEAQAGRLDQTGRKQVPGPAQERRRAARPKQGERDGAGRALRSGWESWRAKGLRSRAQQAVQPVGTTGMTENSRVTQVSALGDGTGAQSQRTQQGNRNGMMPPLPQQQTASCIFPEMPRGQVHTQEGSLGQMGARNWTSECTRS